MTRSHMQGETGASRRRREIALSLADTCPVKLGREIILTGSAARGVADDDSDIEMVCLVDEPPTEDVYAEWLRAALGRKDR